MTSQIFANIYLNELDRFVKHTVKPQAYLRYGDDFILIEEDREKLRFMRLNIIYFLRQKLSLKMSHKNDIIIKTKQGLRFLGVEIFPKGRRLTKRNWRRINECLLLNNVASYSGLVRKHSREKRIKEFQWQILEKLSREEI